MAELHVLKPKVDTEVQDSIIHVLERALVNAKEGKVDTIIVLSHWIDGSWDEAASVTEHFPEAIGHLEILKQSWIDEHLRRLTCPR